MIPIIASSWKTSKNDVKQTWNILRPLIGQHKGTGEDVSELIINDQIVTQIIKPITFVNSSQMLGKITVNHCYHGHLIQSILKQERR